MRKTAVMAILYLIFVFILASFASCNTTDYANNPALIITVRAEVLENNTVTYCNLDQDEKGIYHFNDTIWLNLSTHRIDDTSENTMRAVLKQSSN